MTETVPQPTDSTELDDRVTGLLAQILYVEPDTVDVHAEFATLGLDSILAVEFCTLLKDDLGVTVPAATVYDHRTPYGFTRYLATRLSS
jgi:acyl carrier protein